MRWRAALWVLLALGVLSVCALQFSQRGRVPLQTDLLALLPPTERNPVAETAVAKLADAVGNRAVFLVGLPSSEQAGQAARRFATQLRNAQVFRQVIDEIAPVNPKLLTDFYRPYRFQLLSDEQREALSSARVSLAERLERKLHTPFGFGLSFPLADDPLGLSDAWLAQLPLKSLRLEPQDGLLLTQGADKTWVFVSAELSGSAYDNEVQKSVLAAVSQAEQALHQAYPAAQLLRSGTVFYAGAARASAEREVDLIGAGSLIGMLLLLYLVFRSLRPLALGFLSVGFGIAAAFAVTVWVDGELHLITLVFGASLIGEAIDYAVQYFAAHLGAGEQWEPMAGLRRIAPGLSVALATSLLGYGALMLAPFPALAQIALFALVGLSAAWLSVFLLLPALLTRPNRRDPQAAVRWAQRLLSGWQARMSRRACVVLSGLLLLLAAPGWLQLQGADDIRLLVARPADLLAQEEQLRQLTGLGSSGPFFLIEGATPDEVLAREERLRPSLQTLIKQGDITAYQSLSAFVPSTQRQIQDRALWQDRVFSDPAALRQLFQRSGLRDEIADQQLAAFKASEHQILKIEGWLQTPMSRPYRHLWLGQNASGKANENGSANTYASMVLLQGVRDSASLAQAVGDVPGVTLVDKTGNVSRLFRSYRHGGGAWLLGALGLVYAVLCLRYGWRQALVVLAPTVLAMVLTLGALGYLNTPFTLFHLMGLMLVLGVGVNYAIFLREGGVRASATLAGVLLSAGTTLLSFGLLAFSAMPAMSGFGLTLFLGISMAVLLSPIVLSFDEGRSA